MSRFGRIRNVKSRRKYSDVFDALKEEIVGGKYCAGSVFPSHAKEPKPNGRRINMGAYGNTAEAACSPAGLVLMVR